MESFLFTVRIMASVMVWFGLCWLGIEYGWKLAVGLSIVAIGQSLHRAVYQFEE
jgi:hypothetical protein